MDKEAEILRKCASCHDEYMCQKSRKSRGFMYLRWVNLTKVTLNELAFSQNCFTGLINLTCKRSPEISSHKIGCKVEN